MSNSSKLAKCPDSPNCICTEYPEDSAHYQVPLEFQGDSAQTLSKIKEAIQKSGGVIESETDSSISATFTSKIFKFVDDVDVRLDTENQKVHIRSASRVGYSDLGANRKRYLKIRKNYQTQ